MRKLLYIFLAALFLSSTFSPAFAHSGRTDANGGHYNRKTGEYHYHSGPRTTTSTPQTVAPQSDNEKKEGTVYITRTGKKYHSVGCRYLRASQIPINVNEAEGRGYSPCSVCGGVPCK